MSLSRAGARLAALAGVAALTLGACAGRIGFEPGYVPEERPGFIADGRILIVMPDEQREFVYEGSPDSLVGDFTTLSVPLGDIVRDIANRVFTSCFARGVAFADRREPNGDYVVALEGNMEDFVYRYRQVIERGFDESEQDMWIVPEVDVSFHVVAYDRRGDVILDREYESGVVAGERYRTALRPSERVNETLHATLHALMLQVAADIRPLLIGECTITDLV